MHQAAGANLYGFDLLIKMDIIKKIAHEEAKKKTKKHIMQMLEEENEY